MYWNTCHFRLANYTARLLGVDGIWIGSSQNNVSSDLWAFLLSYVYSNALNFNMRWS
jgi:hypothetical protein